MIRAKNHETVSKFVKVMTKILWPLFFPDTVYNYTTHINSYNKNTLITTRKNRCNYKVQ